ncbi:hypothetical protein RRG08_008876 [Elysia crispata]|uniref:non-specific serine/threonine protein kinase n=1 Tax=Elysia crispata TaxID=231223 RepID=A0AAE0ZXA9_9GAST|nr:hypothetical protein RRG08_008876 [Elysia crispata]
MNKYNRIRQIGEGAFGKAVLVKRKDSSAQCVIKEINTTKMSPKEREESRKEVAVLAQLKHPNIVTYIESFEERGTLYIVMNYCSGGDLYTKINERRGQLFSEDQILNWFVQLCLAIKHIHDRKILHRDIKSQNIFLTSSGKVQLGDFGIAKVLNSTVQLAHTCIGTPYYLSPEIVENMPYNNKSDVWSMGCVLYELTTLKHAFEAGNMKNLVLKIIRGNYPPVSPQFSYDLRGLIAQLFKRNPRDRPNVNAILRKNFIMQRVRKLLSEQDLASEFSHTVMHGHKIAKALPPAPKPSADPARKPAPGPRPGSANKRYDPAAVYGAPLNSARRSSGDQKKRPSTPGRPVPVPGQMDWEKKRKERQDLEQKRRAEMRKREQEMNERRHRDLVEKQKIARINKAREDGWRALIESPVGDEQNRPVTPKENPRPLPVPRVNVDNRERGNYEAYNDFIDKLQRERQGSPPVPERQDKNRNPNHVDVINMAVPRVVPARQRPPQQQQPLQNQFQQQQQQYMGPLGVPGAFDQAGRDRQKGAQAAERARVVEDYLERQRIAAINKRRAQHDLYGHHFGRPSSADRRTPVPAPRRVASPSNDPRRGGGGGGGGGGMLGRNREEQEYLEKLRQIRMQNAKDRRNLNNVAEPADNERNSQDAEERKRKVEALKAQAEQWADLKKKELEKQRAKLLPNKPPSPVPGFPITGALHAIGAPDKAQGGPVLQEGGAKPAVPLTNAMNAIGATPSGERPKSALQKERDNVLKKLNAKGPGRGKWGAPAAPAVNPKEGVERGKWKSPASPTANLAVDEEEGGETARSQWGKGKDLHLSKVSLEQTASQMEATSSADQVLKTSVSDDGGEDTSTQKQSPREQQGNRSRWGRNSGVVKALDKMPICQDTVTLDEASTPTLPVGVGSTITITPGNDSSSKGHGPSITSSNEINSKTENSEGQKKPSRPLPLPPERSGTIVISRGTHGDKLPYTIPTVSTPQPSDKSGEPNIDLTKNEQQAELPSSLHFHEIPAGSGPATPQSPSQTQAALGEVELPSSIRFFNANKEAATPREPVTEEQSKRKLNTLVEVSESQSLSDAQQQSVQQDFQSYLSLKKSQEQKNSEQLAHELRTPGSDHPDSATTLNKTKLSKGLLSDKWGTKSDESRDGAKSVQMNLTSGNFDLRNIELLRTCSEPDLSNLFSTQKAEKNTDDSNKDPDFIKSGTLKAATLKRHKSLDLSAVTEDDGGEDNEEDEFSEEDLPVGDDGDENEEDDDSGDNNNENEDDVDDDDDEDMKSMISTMQSILVENEAVEDTGKRKTKVSFQPDGEGSIEDDNCAQSNLEKQKRWKVKKPGTPAQKVGDDGDKADSDDEEEIEIDGAEGEDHGDDGDDENEDEEDETADRERLELEAALELENGFDSDDETTFGDDDNDSSGNVATKDFDRFGRLEEMRMQLEEQLGVEKLVEVYQAIQQLQEDDDGNMEDGAKVALQLLGPSKQHLFPKIFQLVMSDSVFQEDNS